MLTLCRAADGRGGYLHNGGELGEREGGQGGEAVPWPGQQPPAPGELRCEAQAGRLGVTTSQQERELEP